MTLLDPVQALLAGRHHYFREVPEIRGEPTMLETWLIMTSGCEAPMVAVEGQEGQPIGYRCPKCNATASADGRTEYGPVEIETSHQGKTTLLREPGAAA